MAVDLPGHGNSPYAANPESDYTIAEFGKIISGVADYLELENVIYIRHSIGGHIILQSWDKLRSLKGLVVFGSTPFGIPPAFDKAFLPHPVLDFLFAAYLFYRVPLHTRSEKARMVNPPKIYTIDTGLINAMSFRNSEDKGYLLENIIFMYLRQNKYNVEFIRTLDNYETDFYARHPVSGEILLLQVCLNLANEITFNREIRGLRSAMEEYSIERGTIITEMTKKQ